MSLLYNMLSRFVIAFFPRSKFLLISWLQLPSRVILEPKKIKSVIVSTFSPSICHKIDGTKCYDLGFLNVDLKPSFSLSSFTLIKRLFSSFLLSTIRGVSCAYLRLLIFLLAILIPTCDSSSPLQNSLYERSKGLVYIQTDVSSVTGTHTSYFEQYCQYSSLSLECLPIINI